MSHLTATKTMINDGGPGFLEAVRLLAKLMQSSPHPTLANQASRGGSFSLPRERGNSLTTSTAAQAGGGSFKEKNYKPKKKFDYRMCTG